MNLEDFMKKLLILLICFLGMVCMNCYHEVNNDITIKITNNSSQDLHISFYPNSFTAEDIGPYKEQVTVKFKDVNVKKGESFLLIAEFRYKQNSFGDHLSVEYYFDIGRIEKIIFSKMYTGELIKEVYNIREIMIGDYGSKSYFLEITDELLKGE